MAQRDVSDNTKVHHFQLNLPFLEAVIGFTRSVYDTTENGGKARVGVQFLSGEAAIPVSVGYEQLEYIC